MTKCRVCARDAVALARVADYDKPICERHARMFNSRYGVRDMPRPEPTATSEETR